MAKFISATLAVCRNSEGEILLVQEGKEHVRGKWDFPGGGLEQDESIKECVEREVKEETGYKVESTGVYGVYLEKSDTTDLPVIAFLIEANIRSQGEPDHHFEGEILDHKFYSLDEIESLDLRKDNRSKMMEDIKNKETMNIDQFKDLRERI